MRSSSQLAGTAHRHLPIGENDDRNRPSIALVRQVGRLIIADVCQPPTKQLDLLRTKEGRPHSKVHLVPKPTGHIAGVINPPAAEKYNHWVNEDQPDDLQEWLAGAESRPGSWWQDWDKWLSEFSGEKVKARKPGDGDLPVIENAPGSYAKGRS